jgi:hypothetical protein
MFGESVLKSQDGENKERSTVFIRRRNVGHERKETALFVEPNGSRQFIRLLRIGHLMRVNFSLGLCGQSMK